MHLTFGTGIFWLLIASTVGETIVRAAKALGARRGGGKSIAELQRRVGEMEQRLLEQAELMHAQEDTIARLQESTQFMERLVRERPATKALPPREG